MELLQKKDSAGRLFDVYFFRSWTGYWHPVRPVGPFTYEEARAQKRGYYEAWMETTGGVDRFVKLVAIDLARSRVHLPAAWFPKLETQRDYRPRFRGEEVEAVEPITLAEAVELDAQLIAGEERGGEVECTILRRSIAYTYEYFYTPEGRPIRAVLTGASGRKELKL